MANEVIYKNDNGIATVSLNRPEKKNALSVALFDSLIETGEKLKKDKSVRVVVIHGNGDSFCAGLDVELFKKFGGQNQHLAKRTHGVTNWFQQVAWVWREVPVPVIAAVEGACLGGGLQIACGADMRYVHPEAKMSIFEVNWGLVADMSGTQTWSHFVKQDLIRELSYTGEVFSGAEAMTYGFATRLSEEPLALARKVAEKIAQKNPDAVRSYKTILNCQAYLSAEDGLILESVEQDRIVGQPNQIEAVMANMEKRSPHFQEPLD